MNRFMCGIVLAGLFAVCGQAQAATVGLLNFTGGGLTSNVDANLGWQFQVTAPITVSHLGYFDREADGLIGSHQVGLWLNDGTLLAQTTVQAGTASAIIGPTNDPGGSREGAFRYEPIAPVTLLPGTDYVIAGKITAAADAPFFSTAATFDPQVQFINGRFGGSPTFGFPTALFSNTGGYFGPNFAGNVDAIIPEPATASLGLLSVVGLMLRRRRVA